MPLTWNLTDCAETPETLWSDSRKATTEVLIMSTMSIGIGRWTEGNAPEVYARLKVIESIYGALLLTRTESGVEDRPITPADVRALIGLRTNVGEETRASFIRRHITDKRTGWLTGLAHDFTRAAEKASDAA